jgi:hypothetical protein
MTLVAQPVKAFVNANVIFQHSPFDTKWSSYWQLCHKDPPRQKKHMT